jgi:hypothetical protein
MSSGLTYAGGNRGGDGGVDAGVAPPGGRSRLQAASGLRSRRGRSADFYSLKGSQP